jgi:hypothetical protein
MVHRRSALVGALVVIAAGGGLALLRRAADTNSSAAQGPSEDEGAPVVLRGDGLGAVRFGAPVDEVIAGLTLRWAPPTSDTGWVDAGSSPFGICPGKEVRAVGWRGFSVLFSDGPTPHGPAGRPHFFTWEYRVDDPERPAPDPGGSRPRLRTANGISVGATVAQLRRAYGNRLQLVAELPGRPGFQVQLPEGNILGSVTTLEPRGVALNLLSGGGCRL